MKSVFFAVVLVIAAPYAAAADAAPAIRVAKGGAYAPMADFAPLSGKAFEAQWKDESGTYTDRVRYDLILGGRALQSTHRIAENGYGGRTIIFYDEAEKVYVISYFTNAGFYTTSRATLDGGVMTTRETVHGHETVAEVRSTAHFAPTGIDVETVYVDKQGKESPAPPRHYHPIADPGPLFQP